MSDYQDRTSTCRQLLCYRAAWKYHPIYRSYYLKQNLREPGNASSSLPIKHFHFLYYYFADGRGALGENTQVSEETRLTNQSNQDSEAGFFTIIFCNFKSWPHFLQVHFLWEEGGFGLGSETACSYSCLTADIWNIFTYPALCGNTTLSPSISGLLPFINRL